MVFIVLIITASAGEAQLSDARAMAAGTVNITDEATANVDSLKQRFSHVQFTQRKTVIVIDFPQLHHVGKLLRKGLIKMRFYSKLYQMQFNINK